MTQDEHTSETEHVEITDEPLVDDEKPTSKLVRYILILLAVGMVGGGIFMNYHRAGVLKERREAKKRQTPEPGPRYVDPPPAEAYPWVKDYDVANSIDARIPPPPGTARVQVVPDSFAHWLRYLPVKSGQQKVLLYSGEPKRNQTAHWAVLDIDTGSEDLQQAARAVLRLRAEYLYARNKYDEIAFHVSPKETFSWNRWRKGDRPEGALEGGHHSWYIAAAKPDDSYANFRAYLDTVFKYADANTVAADLKPISDIKDMQIGDVFVHPGKPGHAVIVVDMVQDTKTGDKGFLLAQSFIPAQDMHILVNAYDTQGPWYRTNFNGKLQTPEWTFHSEELQRFP